MEHSRNVINFCFWEKYILRWFPAVGCPSLLSAAHITSSRGEHDYRWFEQDASATAAHYFDKHYGNGVAGYSEESGDFFQLDTFFGRRQKNYYHAPRPTNYNTSQDHYYPLKTPTLCVWDFIIL